MSDRIKHIAQHIINQQANGAFALNKRDEERLQRIVDSSDSADWLSPEIRANADDQRISCTLYVNLNRASDRYEDEAGNLVVDYAVEAKVSNSSYGSMDTEMARRVHNVQGAALNLACEINTMFSDKFTEVLATAEERVKAQAEALVRKAKNDVNEHLKKHRETLKGMRLGAERVIPAGDLPSGQTDDLDGGRVKERYTVIVTAGAGACVTRTA